jgi:hypothetical protein
VAWEQGWWWRGPGPGGALLEEEAMEVGEEGERKGEVNRCRRGENGGVDEVKLRAGAARKAVLGSGGKEEWDETGTHGRGEEGALGSG